MSCCQDTLKDYVDEQDNNEHDNEDWKDVDNDDDDDDDDRNDNNVFSPPALSSPSTSSCKKIDRYKIGKTVNGGWFN